ncbi:DUF1992 domain-containing protein [Virgisporangium aliadipatigenens]|uniref:DUF1992 domain-containing protein n=1 Tax=Virgisporangium aliadipatigenens TaxID=741659 RepID=A0A8J3YFX6_9ACTN|nr:DUF1992 domain-containing protein [Virgisporangium aliadipatigenens]GIJ43522.1 DUF1992 domain-containing protein [Virgisporangium aliadipatigenens]
MTERKPPGMRFESWIDRQIREAAERGDFDDLPGAGKPLPDRGSAYEEDWWLRSFLSRHEASADGMLPPAVLIRRQVDELRETVRGLSDAARVREFVEALNTSIRASWRAPDDGRLPVKLVDVEKVLAQWHEDRAAAREERPKTPEVPAHAGKPKRRWWQKRLSQTAE